MAGRIPPQAAIGAESADPAGSRASASTSRTSLTGRVLPIGGVKQKLLAAHRAGVTTVLIPQRNEPDLDDVPGEVLAKLDVHPVSDVREVLALALEPASTGAATVAA